MLGHYDLPCVNCGNKQQQNKKNTMIMFDSAIELDLYDTLSKLYGDCERLLKLANCPEWQYFLLHPKSLEWLIFTAAEYLVKRVRVSVQWSKACHNYMYIH